MKTTIALEKVMRAGSIQITEDNVYLFKPNYIRHNEISRDMLAVTFSDFLKEVVQINRL